MSNKIIAILIIAYAVIVIGTVAATLAYADEPNCNAAIVAINAEMQDGWRLGDKWYVSGLILERYYLTHYCDEAADIFEEQLDALWKYQDENGTSDMIDSLWMSVKFAQRQIGQA